MPNVTYIKFTNNLQMTWNSFTNTTDFPSAAAADYFKNNNSSIGISKQNLTSNVILLLQEHKNNSRLFNGSSFAIAVVICAFLTLIIGCCCACNWYNQYPNSVVNNAKKRSRHERLLNNRNSTTRSSRNSIITAAVLAAATRNNQSRIARNCFNSIGTGATSIRQAFSDHTQPHQQNGSFLREYLRSISNHNNDIERRRNRNSCFQNNNRVINNSIVDENDESRQEHQIDLTHDIVHRLDTDVESLPSYTLVSGLPTYDDALEQIRKPGILITTPNLMKIFETCKQSPKSDVANQSDNNTEYNNISTASNETSESQETSTSTATICTCDGTLSSTLDSSTLSSSQTVPTIMITSNKNDATTNLHSASSVGNVTQIIELGPEQLNLLSQRRLSVQIAFSTPTVSRSHVNLGNFRNATKPTVSNGNDFALLHANTASISVKQLYQRRASDFVRNSINIKNLRKNNQHRGSLGSLG